MQGFCRDCFSVVSGEGACPCCASPRTLMHPELFSLAIAHVDCDAFFAAVEKRDNPALLDQPVIVGGGVRGVVTTCCYIARLSGVRSAMPMFKARRLCPEAIVIRPDFAKYVQVARQIRLRMARLTPLVEPLSIDEAVLDLSGTEALHGAPPAVTLARFASELEAELGVTVSIGLSSNRLLAKLAASRDKPRGFAVLGSEAARILSSDSVAELPGIGAAAQRRLARLGIFSIGDLQQWDVQTATRALGKDGAALLRRAWGEDVRHVDGRARARSVSAETTFDRDISNPSEQERILWLLSEKLAKRLRDGSLAASNVALKMKLADFSIVTRVSRLARPTALPDSLFEAACHLLRANRPKQPLRLLGIGTSSLQDQAIDAGVDLADPGLARRLARQKAIDLLRGRYGEKAVTMGRGLSGISGFAPDPRARRRGD